MVLNHLTEPQKKAYRIADNKLTFVKKLDIKSIHDTFIKRFVEDGYITQDDLKNFASYNKPLKLYNMERIVSSAVINTYVRKKHALCLIADFRISIMQNI